MATTKIWAIKDSLSRVVNYAKNPEKTIFSDLKQVLKYAENDEKTIEVPLEFSGKWFEEICGEKNSRPPKQILPDKCPCCHKKFDRKSHNPKELCPECAKKKRAKAARERRKREKAQKQ